MNLESYVIKKSLPRLVAAAVLIQFSFLICALLIDIGNVLGEGIAGFIQTVTKGAGAASSGGGVDGLVNALQVVLGGVLALVLVKSFIGQAAVVLIVTVAIAILFAVLSVLATLALRKLILTLLIVISPLAFLAMVLPSTEKFFQLWWKNFLRLIMMYPIIILLFAAAPLARTLAGTNLGDGSVPSDIASDINTLIAAAFPIIACFMIPMTYKWGGQFMGFAAGYATKAVGGIGKAAKGEWQGSRAKDALNKRRESRQEVKLGKNLNGEGRLGKVGKWWAGTKTRGDLLAGRSPELGKDGKWWKPTLKGDRAGVLSRQRAVQVQRMEEEQLRQLREQYNGFSTADLAKRIHDKDISRMHAQAIAGVVSQRGALDQSEVIGGLLGKFKDASGNYTDKAAAQNALAQVRDLNFGSLLTSSPMLTKIDVTQGDDVKMVNGKARVEYGAKTAAAVGTLSGDKLTSQTGPGWKATIGNAQLSRATLETMLQQHHSNAPEHLEYKLADDVAARITQALASQPTKQVFAGGDAIGSQLITDAAQGSIQNTPQLRAKVAGTDAEKIVNRQPLI